MTTRDRTVGLFRPASAADVEALTSLEREANVVALAHVFPDTPFPDQGVRVRWEQVLVEPGVRVEVTGPSARLEALVCWDAVRLRHLAVRPESWGSGLARAAIERATGASRLWCLVDNHRARGLYDHLGWSPTGLERDAEWPPYPREMEYAR